MKSLKIILIFVSMAAISMLYTNCDSEISGLGDRESVFGELPDTNACNNLSQQQLEIYQASTDFIAASTELQAASIVKKPKAIDGDIAIEIDNECLQRSLESLSGVSSDIVTRLNNKLKSQVHKVNISKFDEAKAFNRIQQLGCIKAMAKNHEYKTSSLTSTFNDNYVSYQGYLDSINYEEAYDGFLKTAQGIQPEDNKIVIAVIDTGSSSAHTDLAGQFWQNAAGDNGVNIPELSTSEESDIEDISPRSHGTHLSGLIAAVQNNTTGIVGVGGIAIEVMVVKVFRPDGDGDVTASTSHVINGINWAVNNGANIINLSLSKEVNGYNTDPLFKNAIVNAVNQGVFVTVAAGNSAESGRRITDTGFGIIPARYGKEYEGVLSVGSYDVSDKGKSYFSHYSNQHIEISAPGAYDAETGILSTSTPSASGVDRYSQLAGTSQSAPLVAASAALFMSLFQKYYGALPTPAIVERALVNSATKDVSLSSFFKEGARLNTGELFNYSINNFAKIGEAYGVDVSGLCF